MFRDIDWQLPWYRSVGGNGETINQSAEWKSTLNAKSESMQIKTASGFPVRFVGQSELPDDVSYEAFIYETGQVPTRDNLHDFFNALVWLAFPHVKSQLNALQSAEIITHGIQARRGGLRDAATLFDENAALIVVSDDALGEDMLGALRDHDWQSLFMSNRQRFHQCADVWLFGHALMEKLASPYKSITAHAWVIRASSDYRCLSESERRGWVDGRVSGQLLGLRSEGLRPSLFMPLPVLGIPDWWPEQNAVFYADQAVFRPKRNSQGIVPGK